MGIALNIKIIILSFLTLGSVAFTQENDFPTQNFTQAIEETGIDCSQISEAECQLQLYWSYVQVEDQKPDYSKAMYWLTEAGNAGLLEAQTRLDTAYEYGCYQEKECPFEIDHTKRVYWLEKAAAQGYIYAKSGLGSIYFNGEDGAEQNYEKALYWYRLAANEGSEFSQARIGQMLIEGLGTDKDRIKGLSWLLMSVSMDRTSVNIEKALVTAEQLSQDLKERSIGKQAVKVYYSTLYFFTDEEIDDAMIIANNMLSGYFNGTFGLRYFKRNSLAEFYHRRGELNPEDYEHILYSIVADYELLDEQEANMVVLSFASQLGISENLSRDYIRTITAAEKFRKNFYFDETHELCQQLEDTEFIKLAKSVGSKDKTGKLLKIVWQNVDDDYFFQCFADYAVNQAAADYSLTRNYDYGRDIRYIFAAMKHDDLLINVPKYLLETSLDYTRIWDQLALLGLFEWKLGQLESSENENYVYLNLHYINLLFRVGYTVQARETYLKLTNKQKEIFWKPLENPEIIWTSDVGARENILTTYLNLASSLTASFIEVGDFDTANYYLDKHTGKYDDLKLIREGQVRHFLNAMLNKNINKNDLFDLMIDGYVQGATKPEWGEDFERSNDTMTGWLGALEKQSYSVKNVAHNYLTSIGYDQMGKFVTTSRYYRSRHDENSIDNAKTELESLKGEYLDQFNQRLRKFESAAIGTEKTQESMDNNELVHEHLTSESRPAYFVRKELDEKYWSDEYEEILFSEDEIEQLGIDIHPYQIVRLERKESKIVVIYTSSTLDPTGEISSGGYWILKSDDGGKSWDDPYYTGLQLYFPYIIMPSSKLPLISDDGLNIEVIDRELDKSSISFPPMGLRPLQEVKNLYISVKWEDLIRDQDKDGLTDLFEYKIGLSYLSADTDYDGISDRLDSLPLTPFEKVDQAKNELALALTEKLLGYRKQALVVGFRENPANIADIGVPVREKVLDRTIFLNGSPELFRNTELPFRLIVSNSPEFLDRQDKSGVFYPVRMSWVFARADGNRYYIDWTASWRGGAFSVIKNGEAYELVTHSDWVT